MESMLLGCVAHAVADGPEILPTGTARIGRLTVDEVHAWIEARLRQDFKPAELAAHVRLGLRSLQSAFRKNFSTTISEYLRQRRLDAARAEFLDPFNSKEIGTTAHDLQWCHLSRFAEAYRRQFGELPSTTTRRSRKIK
jgi:transcriptional regulator GlxA family with amidase domain